MIDRAAKRLALGAAAALVLTAPGQVGAASCEGDDCQGPPPTPEEVIPATAVVEGPPNPPVRFPKPKSGAKKKPVKKRQSERAGRR